MLLPYLAWSVRSLVALSHWAARPHRCHAAISALASSSRICVLPQCAVPDSTKVNREPLLHPPVPVQQRYLPIHNSAPCLEERFLHPYTSLQGLTERSLLHVLQT